MKTMHALIRTKHPDTVAVCRDIGQQVGMTMTAREEVADFMLEMLDGDYDVVLFDSDRAEPANVSWVKFIRRFRPKLPLIVFCDEVDQERATQMYEENILYLGLRPLDRAILSSIVNAALQQRQSRNEL